MEELMLAENAPLSRVTVEKWQDGAHVLAQDAVAEEVPVALVYNSVSHVVMLATPQNLQDFALGFSLSEGILEQPQQLLDCFVSRVAEGIHIDMHIGAERFALLEAQRRNLIGRTGCGLCGAATLQQVVRAIPAVHSHAQFSAEQIYAGFAQIQQQQTIQQATGATHASGWMSADGSVTLVREDVGRHNSLDKLLGALVKSGQDLSGGAVLITSRASYEMVQKTATLGIGMLAAISAPTGLAIRLAEQTGITLLGFVRQHSHVLYSGAQRIRHS